MEEIYRPASVYQLVVPLAQVELEMFPQFSSLSPEIKLLVARKLQPIAYVRLRRSSKEMDEFCEVHRNFLRVYARSEPVLYLVNSLKSLNSFSGFFDTPNKPDIEGVYVLVNYGKRMFDSNLLISMTRKNVPVVRAALSGFYFIEVVMWNRNVTRDSAKDAQFDQGFSNFMEATAGLTPRWLTLKNLTDEQIERVGNTWQPTRIEWADNDYREKVYLNSISQNASTILGTVMGTASPIDMYKLSRNKRGVNFDFTRYPSSLVWNCIQKLLKDWKKGTIPLRFLSFNFEETSNYHLMDLTTQGEVLCHLTDAVHLGSTMLHNAAILRNGNLGRMTRKVDYWLYPLEEQGGKCRWGVIKMTRTDGRSFTWAGIVLKTISVEAVPVEQIVRDALEDTFMNGPVLDLSSICQEIRGKPLGELAAIIQIKRNFLINYHLRKYRRSLVNIAVELLLEPGRWPRSILELQKREWTSREERSFLADSAKVLFQEVLCPVYQYCSL